MFHTKPLAKGTVICDMHGRSIDNHPTLQEYYETKDVIMFHCETLSQLLVKELGSYSNKMLVVLDEPWFNDPDWYPAAFSYDGNYVGFLKIRVKC